jgi:hypothetical protein
MARAVKRNYKKEYGKFQSSKKSKKDRVARNKSRRKAMKGGLVKKGDGMDVHHPKGLYSKTVTIITASKNRGKKEKSRLKGSKRK